MQQVAQGRAVTLTASFRLSGTGALIDPQNPHVDILAPDNTLVVDNDAPGQTDVGQYTYTWPVPVGAALGVWQIQWFGTYNGVNLTTAETFEVVAVGTADTTADMIERIRLMLGERIPLGKTETDTRFADAEIAGVYFAQGEDLNKTLAELWGAKAALLADLVDVGESGTTRALSQKAKAALVLMDRWEKKVKTYDEAYQATWRVPGRAIDIFRDECRTLGAVLYAPVTVRG